MPFQPEVHLNLNVRGLGVSATLAINERSNALREQGREVFKLGLGQSPFPVPPPVVSALKAHAGEKDYLPVRGLPALREAVAAYLDRQHHVAFRPEDIMIGPGSKELMFILQLVYYGDLVIPTPSWVSYAPQASIIGRRVHWLPTHRAQHWKLSAASLDGLCQRDPGRPRLVILNYPANPHGYTFTDRELRDIAAVARHHRLILLSDEIYGRLQFDGGHRSIARYYPEGTIISDGLSKWCGAGGWRLGAFAFPPNLHWLRDAMATVASETYTSVAAPIQHAAVAAFQGGDQMDAYLQQCRRILQALAAFQVGLYQRAGLQLAMPDGAFYLFPDFTPLEAPLRQRGIQDSAALCETLLEDTGVATLPGEAFGRPAAELSLRQAFVDFDGQAALTAAIARPAGEPLDDAFLRQHCGRCVTAMERVMDWLDSNR
ncbi:MAG: aminotransferase class I/II-fold pyridoxal phosphate-dependent enzyme [Alcanivorax sp.]|nr:aminotransferase class I/II-fold pyridoxal phosphate-dependent enzyme [Alcanivorax sp.]